MLQLFSWGADQAEDARFLLQTVRRGRKDVNVKEGQVRWSRVRDKGRAADPASTLKRVLVAFPMFAPLPFH